MQHTYEVDRTNGSQNKARNNLNLRTVNHTGFCLHKSEQVVALLQLLRSNGASKARDEESLAEELR